MDGVDGVTVVRAAASDTYPLRLRVLRPHQTIAEMAWRGDDHPDTGHYCGRDLSGRAVATASVHRESPPWLPGGTGWRIRGMATEPARRGRGVGTAVLAAVVDHVERHGGGLLWCHARVPAAGLYRRGGFVTRGDPWTEEPIGEHVVMWRHVEPPVTAPA